MNLSLLVEAWLLAGLRFTPLLLVPAMTPFNWAPVYIRTILLLALAALVVGVVPAVEPQNLFLAAMSELMVGACYGLAVMLPMAALGLPARLLDLQAGLASASLFNPGIQGTDSLLGTILSLAGTMVFFSLGFHLLVFRGLVASAKLMPLGGVARAPSLDGVLNLLGSQFLLGLMVVLPVVLGLFAVDVFVAISSRSMPQANVYFLALPLKVVAVLLLLAASLRLAPSLMGRLFQDALSRASVLGS